MAANRVYLVVIRLALLSDLLFFCQIKLPLLEHLLRCIHHRIWVSYFIGGIHSAVSVHMPIYFLALWFCGSAGSHVAQHWATNPPKRQHETWLSDSEPPNFGVESHIPHTNIDKCLSVAGTLTTHRSLLWLRATGRGKLQQLVVEFFVGEFRCLDELFETSCMGREEKVRRLLGLDSQ